MIKNKAENKLRHLSVQKWNGVLDKACRLIQNKELKRSTLWKKFVEEYRVMKDGATNSWAGEYWGKMMRGACITYEYTRDEELYKVLTDSVKDMLTAQDALGRFSTYKPELEFDGWDMWCRKYVLLAMEYYLDICQSEELKAKIISACCRHADYILEKIGDKTGQKPILETSHIWGAVNSSSILEPMVKLYRITGEKRYLDFSEYIIKCGGSSLGNIFAQALEGKNYPFEYGVNKAYEMISCFEGIAEYYKITGDEKYLIMAENFFRRLSESDVTVIGCCGTEGEQFDNSTVKQSDPSMTGIMQENCVSVTWLKFAHGLFMLTGQKIYADVMEQTAYNALLSAVNLPEKTAPFDSYAALLFSWRGRARGGLKPLAAGGTYGCCECIGSAATGMMPLSAVMSDDEGILINFYEKGFASFSFGTLQIETDYPADGNIKISFKLDKPVFFAIKMRIPAWCRKAVLNGETVSGDWAVIKKEWKDGDTVNLFFEMKTYVQNACEGRLAVCREHIALQRGPLVMARDVRMGDDIMRSYSPVINADGSAEANVCNINEFPVLIGLEVKETDGKTFCAADFGSCGKTLDENSLMTVWLPKEKYWTDDIFKGKISISNKGKYLAFKDGLVCMTDEPFWFETEKTAGDYFRLKAEGKYFSNFRSEENGDSFRFISDKKGCWYIVNRENGLFVSADCSFAEYSDNEDLLWEVN